MKAELKKYSGYRLAAQIIIFGIGIAVILTILLISAGNDSTDSIGITLGIGVVVTIIVYYFPHKMISDKMGNVKNQMIRNSITEDKIYDYKQLEDHLDISRHEIKSRLQKMVEENQIQGKAEKKQFVPS